MTPILCSAQILNTFAIFSAGDACGSAQGPECQGASGRGQPNRTQADGSKLHGDPRYSGQGHLFQNVHVVDRRAELDDQVEREAVGIHCCARHLWLRKVRREQPGAASDQLRERGLAATIQPYHLRGGACHSVADC